MSSNLLTMIVPLSDGASADHLRHPRVDLIEIRGPLPSIAQGFLDGICRATTEWVILANDDIRVSPIATYDWAERIQDAITELTDPYWLLYPDDGNFGESLSIFPILNRMVVLEHLDLIPPFRRYCLDPHLFQIFKALGRTMFLPDILFDHQNYFTRENIPEWARVSKLNEGKNGRIYICKPGPDVNFDNLYAETLQKSGVMQRVATKLYERIQAGASERLNAEGRHVQAVKSRLPWARS